MPRRTARRRELERRDFEDREDGGINLTARWLNTIGLAFGIVGVLIIFIWGPPQPNFDEAAYLSLVGPEAQHNVEDVKRLKRQYQMMSSVGLGLIGLGFGAQLVAVWRAPR
jgi:hypothetical protein